jgi:nucleotide-binding universal stress UspA family protein
MLRIERILCPVDFSEISASIYDTAHMLARRYGAKLLLQHVVELSLPYYEYYAPSAYLAELQQTIRENAEKKLREFAESNTRDGVRPECIVSEGWATGAVLSLAAAQKADLIVLGTHGTKGVDRGALGSVADKVLRKAGCPVLVTRRRERHGAIPGGAHDSVQLQRVVFCTDFSDPAQRALEYALSVAAEYGAELTLLHVVEDDHRPAKLDKAVASATGRLEGLIEPKRGERGGIKTLVRVGRAYEQIVKHASEIQADLIIMAVRGRNALDLAVFGSTTYRVIQLGPCSVLAVHG